MNPETGKRPPGPPVPCSCPCPCLIVTRFTGNGPHCSQRTVRVHPGTCGSCFACGNISIGLFHPGTCGVSLECGQNDHIPNRLSRVRVGEWKK